MAESNLQVLDAAEELTDLSDSELVERYIKTKSTADFELIVARYAKLVMGVCRRVLHHPEDAEDAFQASFVVLAQSVQKLKKRESLGSWLHGVAYRISRRHAHELYRKRMSPLAGEPMSEEDGLKSLETRFEQQLLDEELQRVSEHYREVLVLRYLEDKSSREISEALGVSIGTVEGRLQRGKAELRRRLLRRGVTATGVLMSVELLRNTASASVGPAFIQQTATTAVAASAGGLTSTVVTSLATKEIVVMSASKLAFITACVVLPVTLILSGDSEFSGTNSVAMAQLGGFGPGGSRGSRNARPPRRVIDTSVKWERMVDFPASSGSFKSTNSEQAKVWEKTETWQEQKRPQYGMGGRIFGNPEQAQIWEKTETWVEKKPLSKSDDLNVDLEIAGGPKGQPLLFLRDENGKTMFLSLSEKDLIDVLETMKRSRAAANKPADRMEDDYSDDVRSMYGPNHPLVRAAEKAKQEEANQRKKQVEVIAQLQNRLRQQELLFRQALEKQRVESVQKANERRKHEAVDYYDSSPVEQEIRAVLKEKTHLEFFDTPLKDTIDWFRDLHHMNIVIDQRALEEIGISIDQPVSAKVHKDVLLASALDLVLEPHGLAYIVEDEVMKITSKEVADAKLTTKVYEIRDIAADPEALMGALTAGTETKWHDVDGEGGSISALPGSLVIKQNYNGHQQIVSLLEQIRRHNTNPLYQRVGANPYSGRDHDFTSGGYGVEMMNPGFVRREYANPPQSKRIGPTTPPNRASGLKSNAFDGFEGATSTKTRAVFGNSGVRQNPNTKASLPELKSDDAPRKSKSKDPFGTDSGVPATRSKSPFGAGSSVPATKSNDPFGPNSSPTRAEPKDPFGSNDGFGSTSKSPRKNSSQRGSHPTPSKKPVANDAFGPGTSQPSPKRVASEAKKPKKSKPKSASKPEVEPGPVTDDDAISDF